MKKILFAICSVTLLAVGASHQLAAQSAYKKKSGTTTTTNNTPAATTTAPATTAPAATNTTAKPGKGAAAKNTGAAAANQNANAANATLTTGAATLATTTPAKVDTIPLVYDTTGSIVTPEISLRNAFATDRSQNRDRRPLEYEHLREDDNMWSEFLWREIDAREKMNQSFNYPGTDDNGDRRFFSILINAIQNDSVRAFRDEMFTRPFTTAEVLSRINGSIDTLDIPDLENGGIKQRKIYYKPTFSFDSVYTFRIKEQVIFDKEASRLFTRIIGIAPIAKITTAGRSEPRLLFWLYYPDLRRTFARIDVYNPKNFSSRMTWEELFESRYFSSYITKSSANNPQFLDLLQMWGGNKLRRLYEGDNIKNRIFNFEQDLWQY